MGAARRAARHLRPVPSSIAIDVETKDPDLKNSGPGWPTVGNGEVVGYAIATLKIGLATYLPCATSAAVIWMSASSTSG